MKVKILREVGYAEALFGLGLSHGLTSGLEFFDDFEPQFVTWNNPEPKRTTDLERFNRMESVATKLANKDGGHNKYLRYCMLFLDCNMPRYWWAEADTYKVGTVAQSESTMHTIHKRDLTRADFELEDDVNFAPILQTINQYRRQFVETNDKKYWRALIQLLPQSFLQRRIWLVNYATLRNIFINRAGHRLFEWHYFMNEIKTHCDHPELLQ